jgi:hypothetical protein
LARLISRHPKANISPEGNFGKFLKDVDSGKYRNFALVVHMMDRLSRLDQDDSYQIVRRCWKAGVEVHVAYENRIVSNLNDLITVIPNALRYQGAKDYTDALKERLTQAWALKRAKANGEQPLTRNIPEWLVSNRTVLGELTFGNGQTMEDYYPRIIEPSLFKAVREVMEGKRKHKNSSSMGKRSDVASNLFPGLVFDGSARPVRSMNFQHQDARRKYLYTRCDSSDPKQHRINYGKFETAFLHFLQDLDWKVIANESRSLEEIGIQERLEVVLSEVDRVSRLITKYNKAMDGDDVTTDTLKVLAGKLVQNQAKMNSLTAQKEELQSSLETVKAKFASLENASELIAAIRYPENNEMRLRARAEIRKRVSRIDFDFEHIPIPSVSTGVIHFVNGAIRAIVFDVDRIVLLHAGDRRDFAIREPR